MIIQQTASMKMMTYFMPLMSAFLAISLPSGLGVYWIATAVITDNSDNLH